VRQRVFLECRSSELHSLRRRKVLVGKGLVHVLDVRVRLLQQFLQPHGRVHDEVPCWVLLHRRRRLVHCVRGWPVHREQRVVQLHVVRVRHVQHHFRAHHGVLLSVQRRVLLEQWRGRMQRVSQWDVLGVHGLVFVHQLRLRHLQHNDQARDCVHRTVPCRVLLHGRREDVHCVPCRAVLRHRRSVQLHELRVRSVQSKCCPHGVHV
jgi:hypothetical protein